MEMTFSSLTEYRVKVLWDWWDIQTPGGYIATLFCLFTASVLYQGFRHAHLRLVLRRGRVDTLPWRSFANAHSPSALLRPVVEGQNTIDEGMPLMTGSSREPLLIPTRSVSKKASFISRAILSLMAGLSYAFSLLLMLAAMTYNSGIFLVLVAG
ncbi:unnamed protein product [Discosporangium mesarthrocarpum]